MTLRIGEGSSVVNVGGVPPDAAIELIGQLPADIPIRVRPDYQDQLSEAEKGVSGAGYFGLAVALARETWRD